MKSKKFAIYAKKNFAQMKKVKNIKIRKKSEIREIQRLIVAAHSSCNLRYKIPKEISVVFHNGSTYDYHFIIEEVVKEFKGNCDCLGGNTEKYITFSAPIKKEHKNDKATIYKLKFIDSIRFMSASLLSLVDNLSEKNKKTCKSCK